MPRKGFKGKQKPGHRTGQHGNHAKGPRDNTGSSWDVYQNGEFIGTFPSLTRVGQIINHTPVYCWQMVYGKVSGRNMNRPHTDMAGYTVLKHGDQFGYWLGQSEEQ